MSMESLHDLDADTAFVGVDVGGTSTVVQAVRGSVVRVIDGPGANLQRSGRASCAAAVIMLSAQALRSLHGVDRVRMVAGVSGAGQIGRDTSELQSRGHLVCRLLLEKKTNTCDTDRDIGYSD